MRKKFISGLWIIVVVLAFVLTPPTVRAQQAGSQEEDAVYHAGSIFLSLLLFPIKLTTCVGTQAVSAVAYAATYGVAGHYEGGTNGKEIGEVAAGACRGAWVVPVDQVKKDYE
jgi:hypothetical protein